MLEEEAEDEVKEEEFELAALVPLADELALPASLELKDSDELSEEDKDERGSTDAQPSNPTKGQRLRTTRDFFMIFPFSFELK